MIRGPCQLKPISGNHASRSGEQRHRVYDIDSGGWAASVVPGTKIVQKWRARLCSFVKLTTPDSGYGPGKRAGRIGDTVHLSSPATYEALTCRRSGLPRSRRVGCQRDRSGYRQEVQAWATPPAALPGIDRRCLCAATMRSGGSQSCCELGCGRHEPAAAGSPKCRKSPHCPELDSQPQECPDPGLAGRPSAGSSCVHSGRRMLVEPARRLVAVVAAGRIRGPELCRRRGDRSGGAAGNGPAEPAREALGVGPAAEATPPSSPLLGLPYLRNGALGRSALYNTSRFEPTSSF